MITAVALTPEVHDLIAPADGEPARSRRCAAGMAIYRGKTLVGMGGVILQWPGHADAWMIPAGCRKRDLVKVMRWARLWLDAMQGDTMFRRVNAHVRWSEPWRETFMRVLGFEFEAHLRAWGPDGADVGLYSRLRLPIEECFT